MSFEGLLGNAPALRRLTVMIEGGRRPHAFLFGGPEGVGKALAAVEYGKALGATPILIQRREDKQDVILDQIHELTRELSMTSAKPRVIVIDDAHRMSEEAQNAILKTLEEPPANTTIILVTHVPDKLLGTIRSRCQTLFFHPLADAEIEGIARSKHRLDGDRAKIATLLARGSIGALSGLIDTLDEIISAARDLQERSVTGELNKLIEALGKIKDNEEARARAKRDLGLVAQALREVLLARTGYKPVLATPTFLQKLSKLDEDAILERIETLIDHARMIDLNANVGLCVEDALLRV
ncbi:MAG TPA: AAA family ATPase [Planctomycetota bacterium]